LLKNTARRIFSCLLGVWKWGQTRYFVFDLLHEQRPPIYLTIVGMFHFKQDQEKCTDLSK